MARRRWVYMDGEVHEVALDWTHPPRHTPVIGDRHYDGLTASDGTPIDTRTKHKAYMKAKGLTTIDDYKDYWAKEADRRALFFEHGGDWQERKERRAAIERAMHEHLDKRR